MESAKRFNNDGMSEVRTMNAGRREKGLHKKNAKSPIRNSHTTISIVTMDFPLETNFCDQSKEYESVGFAEVVSVFTVQQLGDVAAMELYP